ncbi:biotin/lipoyl-containing protein [Nonomuraea sp. B19D2]|uniref:biotin/lipoyl-containing protein n=1 Tax=Nonomuraea sp. B19D2 TaxID=3159561 RepID=UPI0032DAE5F1
MSNHVFTLPDLGEGLTEAHLVRWLVKPGDQVAIDEPIAEVETAKPMVEVPSPYGGVVAELHGAEGTTLEIGEPLITIESGQPAAATIYVEEERAGSGNVLIGYGTSAGATSRSHRGRKLAAPAPAAPPDPTPSHREAAPRRLAAGPQTGQGKGSRPHLRTWNRAERAHHASRRRAGDTRPRSGGGRAGAHFWPKVSEGSRAGYGGFIWIVARRTGPSGPGGSTTPPFENSMEKLGNSQ